MKEYTILLIFINSCVPIQLHAKRVYYSSGGLRNNRNCISVLTYLPTYLPTNLMST